MKTLLQSLPSYKKIFIAFVVSILLSTSQSFSQAGTLDSTFGVNGKVITLFNTPEGSFAFTTAIQSDGKIIVFGDSVSANQNTDFALVRYKSNGTVDSSFGTNGKVRTHFGDVNTISYSFPQSLVIQQDGKIIAGGYNPSLGSFNLARYLPNGNLDLTFGINGLITTQLSTWREVSLGKLALQSDGKILAGGAVDGFCLIRYNSNGSIDSSFGINGKIENDGDFRSIKDISILQDGRIVVGLLNPTSGDNYQFEIDRLLSNGSIDPTFGNNGSVLTDFDGASDWLSSIAILSNGEIVAAGYSSLTGKGLLSKYKTNGPLDLSFGINGKLFTTFDATSIAKYKVLIQQNEKILIAGSVLARLNVNGVTDSTFGVNGVATNFDGALDALLQPEGKIVSVNGPNFMVARLKGDITVSIQKNITKLEGNSGTTTSATFKVLLSAASTKKITINYATVDSTAKARQDYVAKSGTLTFNPGQTSKSVAVSIIGDNIVEPNEKFSFQLSNTKNAILGTLSTATCTIKNDDPSFTKAVSNEIVTTSNINLFPNPARNVLQIEGLNKNTSSIVSVINMQGQLVSKKGASNSTYLLDVKQLSSGIYFVRIESKNSITTLKFVKE